MIKRSPDLSAPAGAPAPAAFRFADVPPPVAGGRRMIDDLDLVIDRRGQWFYHGSLIERRELVCLFASVLRRDEAGGYWLVTPAEMGRVVVEDAPFLAVEMFVAGDGPARRISFRTNIDEIVEVDDAHPLIVDVDAGSGEPSPYVLLDRGMRARLTPPVFYDLVALAERDGEPTDEQDGRIRLGVWSAGCRFVLGEIES